MAPRGWSSVLAVILVLTQAIPWGCWAWAGSPEEIEQKLKVLQEQVNDLKQQLDQSKTQATRSRFVASSSPVTRPSGSACTATSSSSSSA